MDPHPLVAFALRIPSRMASTLTSFSSDLPEMSKPRSDLLPAHQHRNRREHKPPRAHMVVNLLSSSQAELAHKFSRPDLFPHPFSSLPYTMTAEGLPVLQGSLGAISCRLVAQPLKLSELKVEAHEEGGDEFDSGEGAGGVVSELYIAQVVRVERLPLDEAGKDEESTSSPLLYYKRKYTSC
ncbi:hypothetical protein FA15DRAFT_670709 [Coprinopsis marcescibilis]|uniref:Flavin reductase like domain-containing protein n=1 Tax=Coprinopsis marcescibilis TaxID=230819 RepID=A0A5C3KRG7_COPMA|nr:hypothetical protein FA15DRAFT_670709 [Coprinopsis marcescibilis]